MRKLISSLVLIGIFFFSTNSFSYNSDPKIFIAELIDDATKTLSDKSISKADKKKKDRIHYSRKCRYRCNCYVYIG